MKLTAAVVLRDIVALIDGARLITPTAEISIEEISDDSRDIGLATLYVSLPAENGVQWRHLADAQRRGALAVMIESDVLERFPEPAAVCVVVPDVQAALGRIAAWANNFPARDMTLIGVTGTNGKTTVTHCLEWILNACGHSAGYLGTLGVRFDQHSETFGYTTPPALVMQPLLARMKAAGVRTVAMEVSSHALALQRVASLHFAAGIFTNLGRDHLDFHKSEEAYIAAKRRLFTLSEHCIINLDDPVGRQYYAEFGGTGYTLDPARDGGPAAVRAEAIEIAPEHSRFRVAGQAYVMPLPGRFNIANALAVIAAVRRMGIADARIAAALAEMPGVPGRMERFSNDRCTVLVDYAHTPDALERVLETAREMTTARVFVVFGCGGGRDAGKRPQMGAVAERLADRCYLTSDNPRSEDPRVIMADIRAGMQREPAAMLEDRAAAIDTAIAAAEAGDVVVVAGKGAETEQIAGNRRRHFDDREQVRAALAQSQTRQRAFEDPQ